MAIKYWNYSSCNIDSRADIGDECVIHSHVVIHRNVKVGRRCRIQCFTFIPDGVTLEDNVFVGPGVIFTNDPDPGKGSRETWKPTKTLVERGAVIGAGAKILAGVTIGEGAEIGMGSVVLSNVPDNQLWVGVPAKFLRYR